ncbi:phage replisome organizer N-terminal domain-containing protein, partial [Enterococcus faecalis]
MAEISWIKLKTTMFDDEKIKLIQSMPEADAILVIWIR